MILYLFAVVFIGASFYFSNNAVLCIAYIIAALICALFGMTERYTKWSKIVSQIEKKEENKNGTEVNDKQAI